MYLTTKNLLVMADAISKQGGKTPFIVSILNEQDVLETNVYASPKLFTSMASGVFCRAIENAVEEDDLGKEETMMLMSSICATITIMSQIFSKGDEENG